MLGSVDSMHWRWKNFPTTWHGQFTGHCHNPTIILEVVASEDSWIWHFYFGLPRSHNDINALQRSYLFARLACGTALARMQLHGELLPVWPRLLSSRCHLSILVNICETIYKPMTRKHKHFAKPQEAIRKDIKKAFRVLQARFAIVQRPARFWNKDVSPKIMTCCVILHNMVIKYERDMPSPMDYENAGTSVRPPHKTHWSISWGVLKRLKTSHDQLCEDIIEHQWQLAGK